MKNFLIVTALILVTFGFGFGCWKLERWTNYKFSYQSQVQSELQPLKDRISELEKRVYQLENSK